MQWKGEILGREVKKGLADEVIWAEAQGGKEGSCVHFGGRGLSGRAKALRHQNTWHVWGAEGSPYDWKRVTRGHLAGTVLL